MGNDPLDINRLGMRERLSRKITYIKDEKSGLMKQAVEVVKEEYRDAHLTVEECDLLMQDYTPDWQPHPCGQYGCIINGSRFFMPKEYNYVQPEVVDEPPVSEDVPESEEDFEEEQEDAEPDVEESQIFTDEEAAALISEQESLEVSPKGESVDLSEGQEDTAPSDTGEPVKKK